MGPRSSYRKEGCSLRPQQSSHISAALVGSLVAGLRGRGLVTKLVSHNTVFYYLSLTFARIYQTN
jgi:hypothetical protein